MKFVKMHGIGNDFIVIENRPETYDSAALGNISRQLCNRNIGVGSDGLVVVIDSDSCDFRMRMMNPDGSEAQMCGNGIRVFAKYVYDYKLTDKESISVETAAGVKYLKLTIEDGKVTFVRVDMGEPILQRSLIPMLGEDTDMVVSEPLTVCDTTLNITAVSMGNPHCVSFVDDVDSFPLAKFGPAIENHPLFPERTNVEFIQVVNDKEIKMRVWERGANETMACGTGACASSVAGILNGKTSRILTVHLRGGDLFIEWADNNRVIMTGPAVTVYEGTVDENLLNK